VPTQTWKVVVTKLGGSDIVGEVEVDATNWMGALRVGRERLGEPPTMPAGASCSVDGGGAATVLDPAGRRKLVLTPLGPSTNPSSPAPAHDSPGAVASPDAVSKPVVPVSGPVSAPVQASAPAAGAEAPPGKKRKRFETVAFVPGHLSAATNAQAPVPVSAPASAPTAAAPVAAAPALAAVADAQAAPVRSVAPEARGPSTVPAAAEEPSSERISSVGPRASQVGLELLLQRSEDASPNNPICYRERAYYVPRGVSVQETEASLRFELVAMQNAMQAQKRGKLINLAAFDHRWADAPERPPVVTLQWRDWKGEVLVDFPAARIESPPPRAPSASVPLHPPASDAPAPHDDRLDEVFQGLAELSRLQTPVDGLDLAVRLLETYVPSEAHSACLYDINTDELRFVSVLGEGAGEVQGKAAPLAAGLLGQVLRKEHRSSIFGDVLMEPAFNPEVDSRPGLDARSMLICPVVSEGHLLGGLQLVNRLNTHRYSQADANVASYIAERLGEFLHDLRKRRSSPPISGRPGGGRG
jgi:hypothetical protein